MHVDKNFEKLTRNYLCQSLFFNKFEKKGLWYRCFPVNFAKCSRTPLYKTPVDDYFC